MKDSSIEALGQSVVDVVICGGGLAGLTLARQLRRAFPDLGIVQIERTARPLPEAAHKVGESSVELACQYFESLGLKNGKLQAMNVTYLELAAGAALVVGLLTPLAYGGAASIVLVALVTNHWKNGFWSFLPGEGWEYTGTLTALCIALATFGPGEWSLDDAIGWDFPFEPDTSLLIAAVIGLLGTAVFLAVFWRPPQKTPTSD